MRFLTRLSLFFLSLISFSVIAAPINKTDLAVVEKMYKDIGLSIAGIDTTRRVDHIDIELKNSALVNVYPYDKDKHKLHFKYFLLNESGRIVYLKIPKGVDGKKLTSLSGVENLEALEVLRVRDHKISNLKPLSKLKNIRGLDLSRNNIKNTSSLRYFSKLEFLNLNYNSLESTRFFSGLKSLKSLECKPCKISSLKGMEVMQYLQYIRINAEEIVSIEEIRSLEGLRNITMNVGDVTDFSPLGDKLKLERLHINGGAGSLSFLSSLVNLEKLYLIDNKFNSIPDLSKLKEIKTIELSRTAIKKITGLENLSSLENLILNHNKKLTKIEGLDGLISLRDLKFKGSSIEKMENLNLPKLESLDLSKTDVTKMESMGGMPELYDLAIHDTRIKKIEGYLDAPKLTDVGVEYSGEFYENNKEAIEFLGRRKKAKFDFLMD